VCVRSPQLTSAYQVPAARPPFVLPVVLGQWAILGVRLSRVSTSGEEDLDEPEWAPGIRMDPQPTSLLFRSQ
jgi:hypothetical protein